MIDIENLDKYIIIPTGSADPSEVEDLRDLEGDYPQGVYALWSDGEQTIVAFAFDPLKFDEEGARAWIAENIVTQAIAQGDGAVWPSALWKTVTAIVGAMIGEISERLDIGAITIGDNWYVSSGSGLELADEGRAWDWTTAKGDAIIDALGWRGYARAHLVTDLGLADEGQKWPEVKDAYTYPLAEMIGGELSVVLRAAQSIYANMRGGRATPDLSKNVLEAGLDTVKRVYRRFGKDTEDMKLRGFDEIRKLVQEALDSQYQGPVGPWERMSYVWIVEMGQNHVVFETAGKNWAAPYEIDENSVVTLGEPFDVSQGWTRPDGSTIMLYSFDSRLGSGDEADDDDGLLWKEIVRPGKFFKTNTGSVVEITAEIIKNAFQAWKDGLPQYISVPSESHHRYTYGVVPPEENRGFVEKLKLIADRLFGGFRLTDPETEVKVYDGSIVDCSVYLRGNVHHPETGELYPWILQHVLLTNDPLVQGLGKFGQVPAGALALSGGAYSVHHIRLEEVSMSEDTNVQALGGETQNDAPPVVSLTTADVAELEQYRALGAVADITAITAQRESLAQRGRALRVAEIVAALESTAPHDGIVQVEGRRHYPVIVAAAEGVLLAVPIADVMAAGDDQTQTDRVVIEILNALPADARLEIPPVPALDRTPPAGDEAVRTPEGDIDPDKLTDEAIDELDRTLTGAS